MSKVVLVLVELMLLGQQVIGLSSVQKQSWVQVWGDEFEGVEIDKSKWRYDIGGGGWGNEELQIYTNDSSNSFIRNGSLVIKAVLKGTQYTSARLKTEGLYSVEYGIIEMRAKLPIG